MVSPGLGFDGLAGAGAGAGWGFGLLLPALMLPEPSSLPSLSSCLRPFGADARADSAGGGSAGKGGCGKSGGLIEMVVLGLFFFFPAASTLPKPSSPPSPPSLPSPSSCLRPSRVPGRFGIRPPTSGRFGTRPGFPPVDGGGAVCCVGAGGILSNVRVTCLRLP